MTAAAALLKRAIADTQAKTKAMPILDAHRSGNAAYADVTACLLNAKHDLTGADYCLLLERLSNWIYGEHQDAFRGVQGPNYGPPVGPRDEKDKPSW